MCDVCERASSPRTFTGDSRDLWREPPDWQAASQMQSRHLHQLQEEVERLREGIVDLGDWLFDTYDAEVARKAWELLEASDV